MEYNPTIYICQGKVAVLAKCNNTQYNPLEKDCCVSTIFIKANQRCGEGDVVETKCGQEWYNSKTHFCVNEEIISKCGGNEYDLKTEQCCGNSIYTIATQFCYEDKVAYFCGNRKIEYDPDKYQCKSINENGIYLKEKPSDGTNSYEAVLIGEQVWFAENLNTTTEGSYCYQNYTTNCQKYGRLYNWAAAMDIDQDCNSYSEYCNAILQAIPSKHRGICPEGWHIPDDSDWDDLMEYVQTDNGNTYDNKHENKEASVAGKYLKATSDWENYNVNGEDKYGFAALPSGDYSNYSYGGIKTYSSWWTAGEEWTGSVYHRLMYNYRDAMEQYYTFMESRHSVRCIQDDQSSEP
jgi:uncharacterized protein (TIGR02145 family)